MKQQINISLDYDGCTTLDPSAWLEAMQVMRQAGHKVFIVTMRFPSECKEIRLLYGNKVDGIFPTSRMAKQPYMQAQGIVVHVWIDDTPQAIHMDASKIWSNGPIAPEGSPIDQNNAGVIFK